MSPADCWVATEAVGCGLLITGKPHCMRTCICICSAHAAVYSQRAGGEAVELVLKIAKLSLSLVQCATSKDAKGFVAVIKELKPVLFTWKDEAAVYSGTNFAFTKAELSDYGNGTSCRVYLCGVWLTYGDGCDRRAVQDRGGEADTDATKSERGVISAIGAR